MQYTINKQSFFLYANVENSIIQQTDIIRFLKIVGVKNQLPISCISV